MSEKNDKVVTSNESGSINYSNDVLAKIAALATDEVDGVAGTSAEVCPTCLASKTAEYASTLKTKT